jgi:hypothetical protein
MHARLCALDKGVGWGGVTHQFSAKPSYSNQGVGLALSLSWHGVSSSTCCGNRQWHGKMRMLTIDIQSSSPKGVSLPATHCTAASDWWVGWIMTSAQMPAVTYVDVPGRSSDTAAQVLAGRQSERPAAAPTGNGRSRTQVLVAQ